jgi:hypothetical protein
MHRQCTQGPIDVVTGDYLAELNLAWIAEGVSSGTHTGYELSAKEGILLSLEVAAERGIRIAVNGGALNPRRLAEEVYEEVKKRGLGLRVAYVSGDNLIGQIDELEKELTHLDAENGEVKIPEKVWLSNPEKKVVSANAYLGARGIKTALEEGADIVICMFPQAWMTAQLSLPAPLTRSTRRSRRGRISGHRCGVVVALVDRRLFRPSRGSTDRGPSDRMLRLRYRL